MQDSASEAEPCLLSVLPKDESLHPVLITSANPIGLKSENDFWGRAKELISGILHHASRTHDLTSRQLPD